MAPRRTSEYWQQRYVSGDLPWDTGTVAPELVTVVAEIGLVPGDRVMEIGCGTGVDSCWLAEQGFGVVGIDIAPEAIARAQQRAMDRAVSRVRFLTGNILEQLLLEGGRFAFAYDHGCFHAVEEAQRPLFSDRVFQALEPMGYWLTMCGNADEHREKGVHGPPQLSARQIVNVVEDRFSVVLLAQRSVRDAADTAHLSWTCLMRRRS